MKAVHAMLNSDVGWATFKLLNPEHGGAELSDHGQSSYRDYVKSDEGYVTLRQRVSLNHWHFLFVSKDKRLMLGMDESSVWRKLRGEEFTTPLIRSWVPYLTEKMKGGSKYGWMPSKLSKLDGFGHSAGLMTATTDYLDGLVKDGLQNGEITIE